MADWIDYYPWPGILDMSDVAHLFEERKISRRTILRAFGISEEEYNAELRRRESVQRDESKGTQHSGGRRDGVRAESSG